MIWCSFLKRPLSGARCRICKKPLLACDVSELLLIVHPGRLWDNYKTFLWKKNFPKKKKKKNGFFFCDVTVLCLIGGPCTMWFQPYLGQP